MDVTSLLNSGAAAAAAAAAEQQKKLDSTRNTPARNRTPWDAGGYSLPINTIALAPQVLPLQPIHFGDSRHLENQTPTSPAHKFSDSRSSLSSFTSSLQSATHSRYSSMSTVNSSHPLNSLALECLSPKLRNVPQALEIANMDSSSNACRSTSLSPTGSLETLALAAEHQSISKTAQQSSDETTVTALNSRSTSQSLSQGIDRPSSPSDAILIKRSAIPILRVNTGDADLKREDLPQLNENYLSAPLDNFLQQPTHNKMHQRSYSAPNLWAIMGDSAMQHDHRPEDISDNSKEIDPIKAGSYHNNSFALNHQNNAVSRPGMVDNSDYSPRLDHNTALNQDKYTHTKSLGPLAEPTPPSSHHPDHPSPTGESISYTAPDTPPIIGDLEPHRVECMFVDACNTGSQLRKAISHILGRNKLCTRQIPKEIWVHFCRKHYQRSRYRNPKEYSKLQCDLVQKQIRRIHEWSKENAEAGRSGVVQDWELTIRKREQKRLDELSATNRKRRIDAFEDDDNEDEDGSSLAANSRPSHALTAVPQWLLDCCRKGYTTKGILEVFNRLHTEVLADRITHFPDIEILPNITTDPDLPKSPKGYAKRTPITHRRTQSLGTAMQSSSASPVSRSSQSSIWNEDAYGSPQQKRRRPGSRIEEPFDETSLSRSRLGERPVDTGRRLPQLAHRPVFPDIRENQREEYGDKHYTGSPSSYQNPLPAPTPQRSNGYSMAAHLEFNNDYTPSVRRSLHGRSRSDISDFGHHQMEYAPPSGGLCTDANHQTRNYQGQGRGHNGHAYPIPHQYLHHQYRDESPAAGQWSEVRVNDPLQAPGHQRHQSTPQASYAPPSISYGRKSQLANHPPFQQANNNSPFTSRRILGTDGTGNMYSARR